MDAFLLGTIVAALGVPAAVLARDIRQGGAGVQAVSPFWYFTLLWVVAFPLRAWVLASQVIEPQSHVPVVTSDLTVGLGLGVILWLAVRLGYRKGGGAPVYEAQVPMALTRPVLVLAALAVAGIAVQISEMQSVRATVGEAGVNYFRMRAGQGWLFLIPELASLALVALVPALMGGRWRGRAMPLVVIALALAAVEAALMLLYLLTRRNLALVLMLVVLGYALSKPNRHWLAAFATFGTLVGGTVLELGRWMLGPLIQASWPTIHQEFLIALNNMLYAFSNTFEGADHVARLYSLCTPVQLLAGIDHGVSWAFNVGLSLVPRALWPSKPLATGNLAQQEFLYPDLFRDHISIVAQPPSFVVDYMYGFGLPGALLLAFATGWLLRRLGTVLVHADAPVAARAIALFFFVNLFNLVRSGTGFASQIIIFAGVLVVMYGPARCLDGVRALLPLRRLERTGAAGQGH